MIIVLHNMFLAITAILHHVLGTLACLRTVIVNAATKKITDGTICQLLYTTTIVHNTIVTVIHHGLNYSQYHPLVC